MSKSSDKRKVLKNNFRNNALQITLNNHCLKCGEFIIYPKEKFCSPSHKNIFNHKHKYAYKYSHAHRSTLNGFLNAVRRKSTKHRRRNITLKFLQSLFENQKGRCALSGIEMTFLTGQGKQSTNISIDRIDSAKGYEESNIQLVCTSVNLMKSNLTDEQFVDFCRKVVKYHDDKESTP